MRSFIARHPLLAGALFQGALIPVAFALAALAGVPLLDVMDWSIEAVALGLLVTTPMFLLVAVLGWTDHPAFRDIRVQLQEFLDLLFRGAPAGSVVLIAVLAGVGEELLVRGVLQQWLGLHLPPGAAILLASVLFGLAHYVSHLYFLFATLIGLYLGWVYHVTENLVVVMIAHAAYDWAVIRWYLARPA